MAMLVSRIVNAKMAMETVCGLRAILSRECEAAVQELLTKDEEIVANGVDTFQIIVSANRHRELISPEVRSL